MIDQIEKIINDLNDMKSRVIINKTVYHQNKSALDTMFSVTFIPTDLCEPDKLYKLPSIKEEREMNNDPYSWCNIDRLDQMIKDQKREFKTEELKKEEGNGIRTAKTQCSLETT